MKICVTLTMLCTVAVVQAGRVYLENSTEIPMNITIAPPSSRGEWSKEFPVTPFSALTKPIGYSYTFIQFQVTYFDRNNHEKKYLVEQKKCMNGRIVTIDLAVFLEDTPILSSVSDKFFKITKKQ